MSLESALAFLVDTLVFDLVLLHIFSFCTRTNQFVRVSQLTQAHEQHDKRVATRDGAIACHNNQLTSHKKSVDKHPINIAIVQFSGKTQCACGRHAKHKPARLLISCHKRV
jgi:hypothetical protein